MAHGDLSQPQDRQDSDGLQVQQACLLAELLLAVLLQHFAETRGDAEALSRLGDIRVSGTNNPYTLSSMTSAS